MSIMAPRPTPAYLPRAHDGCQCDCHKIAGVMHCVPCCGHGAPLLPPRDPADVAESERQLKAYLATLPKHETPERM